MQLFMPAASYVGFLSSLAVIFSALLHFPWIFCSKETIYPFIHPFQTKDMFAPANVTALLNIAIFLIFKPFILITKNYYEVFPLKRQN